MSKRASIWRVVRIILAIGIVGGTAWFFYHEFRTNWTMISETDLHYRPAFLAGAFLLICAAYLVNTMAWQKLINLYAASRKITLTESIAVVNTSQLTKYLPGKVWSFALQIWWLGERGFSRPMVFFVNLAAMIFSLLATTVTGLLLLAFTGTLFSGGWAIAVIIICLLVYLIFTLLQNKVLKLFIYLYNRLFKKEIPAFEIRTSAFLQLQAIYLFAALLFCGAIALVCPGIGTDPDALIMLQTPGAVLVSDAIGFIVLIAPGGLGVREGLMYVILEDVASLKYALILPIATRLLTMGADLLFGILGMLLFRKFRKMK